MKTMTNAEQFQKMRRLVFLMNVGKVERPRKGAGYRRRARIQKSYETE